MYIYSLKSLISDAEGSTILTSWWWSWLSAAGSFSLSGRSHYTDQYSEQCTSLSALSASNTTVEQVYTETRSTCSNIGTSSSTKTCSCPHRQAKRPVEETNTEPVHRKLSSSRHNGHSWLIQHDKCPKHTSRLQRHWKLAFCAWLRDIEWNISRRACLYLSLCAYFWLLKSKIQIQNRSKRGSKAQHDRGDCM